MPKCDQCGADMVWQGSMKDGGLKCLNLHYEIPSEHPQEMKDYIDRLKLKQSAQIPQVPQIPARPSVPVQPPDYRNNFRIEQTLGGNSLNGSNFVYRLCCDNCGYAGKWGTYDLTKDIGMYESCPDCGKNGLIHA